MDQPDVAVSVLLPSTAVATESADAVGKRLRILWALDEIRAGRMTRVAAARWLSLSLDAFFAEAERHGLPAFDYDMDDFRAELDSLA